MAAAGQRLVRTTREQTKRKGGGSVREMEPEAPWLWTLREEKSFACLVVETKDRGSQRRYDLASFFLHSRIQIVFQTTVCSSAFPILLGLAVLSIVTLLSRNNLKPSASLSFASNHVRRRHAPHHTGPVAPHGRIDAIGATPPGSIRHGGLCPHHGSPARR